MLIVGQPDEQRRTYHRDEIRAIRRGVRKGVHRLETGQRQTPQRFDITAYHDSTRRTKCKRTLEHVPAGSTLLYDAEVLFLNKLSSCRQPGNHLENITDGPELQEWVHTHNDESGHRPECSRCRTEESRLSPYPGRRERSKQPAASWYVSRLHDSHHAAITSIPCNTMRPMPSTPSRDCLCTEI